MNVDLSPLVIWTIAGIVALSTPIMGYLSPFGRARRGMVKELQDEIKELRDRVDGLRAEVTQLSQELRECETARVRLERENYRLYRELDNSNRAE
jgi:chromosome segregation ATPase